MIKHFCDRCETQTDSPNKLSLQPHDGSPTEEKELCKDCLSDLRVFIDGGEIGAVT